MLMFQIGGVVMEENGREKYSVGTALHRLDMNRDIQETLHPGHMERINSEGLKQALQDADAFFKPFDGADSLVGDELDDHALDDSAPGCD